MGAWRHSRTRRVVMAVLCAMVSFPLGAAAKHIVITYDMSGSMYRVGGATKMTQDDVRRLNQYVMDLLFGPLPLEAAAGYTPQVTPLTAPGTGMARGVSRLAPTPQEDAAQMLRNWAEAVNEPALVDAAIQLSQ